MTIKKNHRHLLLALLPGLLLALAPASAELPKTLEEFQQRHEETSTSPEAASKLLLDAIFAYINEDTRAEAAKMIEYLCKPNPNISGWERRPSFGTFLSRLKDSSHHHIWRSYAKGATPDNGYEMDPNDYELNIDRVEKRPDEDLGTRVWWVSSGADRPRPVFAQQSTKTGLWYIYTFDSIYSGVRQPKDPDAEEFE